MSTVIIYINNLLPVGMNEHFQKKGVQTKFLKYDVLNCQQFQHHKTKISLRRVFTRPYDDFSKEEFRKQLE